MSDEPTIAINGTLLSVGQAMALRVAATIYMMDMREPDALGQDLHGRAMVQAYRERLTEVLVLMTEAKP